MVEITSHETVYTLAIAEASGVGEARRTAATISQHLNFNATVAGRVALVITEVTSNLVKHAGGGDLVLQTLSNETEQGIQILALDKGPGIRSISDSMQDGYSSYGSAGTGLGAIKRLSDTFDIYSGGNSGTAVLSEIWSHGNPRAHATFQSGVVSVPYPGEDVCGDGWAIRMDGDCCRMMIADGLGHGAGAATASREAVFTFSNAGNQTTDVLLESIHGALRKTRGAAVAIAEIDRHKHSVEYSGLGNISGLLQTSTRRQSLVSHNGTAGLATLKAKPFSYEYSGDGIIVMSSDGLSTHWTLNSYPGVMEHHPALIAGILYRDFRRGRDDVTVLVVK